MNKGSANVLNGIVHIFDEFMRESYKFPHLCVSLAA
jgi:hypothetical protein